MSEKPQSTDSASPAENKQDTSWETYKRLLRYSMRYAHVFGVSVFGFMLFAVTQPAGAELIRIITETIENPTPGMILLISVAPAALALLRGFGQFLGNYFITWIGQRIVFEIRNDVFQHVLRLPLREYQANATGRIMSKIIFDAEQVSSAATDAITITVREGLTVIGLMSYLLYQNWKLTLILFTVGPVIALVVNATSRRFRTISKRIQGSMGNITQYLGEAIDGHQPVKIFAGQNREASRFHSASRQYQKQNIKLAGTKIASTTIVQMVVSAGVGVLIYLYLTVAGEEVSVGQFLAYLTAAGLMQKPLKQLTDVNAKIQRGVTGAASLFELMDRPAEQDEGTRDIERAQGHLEFRHVSFSYDEKNPVLDDVTFEIRPGETVALVGRSGAGKSTISSLVPRFYDPDAGEILLDGVPLRDYRLESLRRQIAMVSQKVVLFNDTIRNNIAYGELDGASEDEVLQAARDAFALDFIEQLDDGFDTEVGQDGIQLSGGQRQRIAIARALLKNAPILILDEATSALDTESEFRIQKALEVVMRGRTTIVIAHRLSTIEKADRILVLDQGRVVQSGKHEELLAEEGLYTQLYRMNFEE